MKEVTDPALLNTLEGKEVTDPNVLAQLEGGQTPAEPSAGGFFDMLRRYKDSRVNDTSLSPGEKTVREIIWGLVPETPGQALATGIMAAAGPASLPLKAAGRAAPAIARTLAGAGAGAAGAAVDNGDVGQGALVGGGVTGAVESALPIGSKLLRSLPWMKGAIARMDAKRIGNTVGEIVPEFAGRKTAEELQNLGRVYTQALPGGGGKQALRGLFQDLESRIGSAPINIPSLGGKSTVSDALEEISKLGPRGYGGQNANVMTRTATGMDARALREQLLDELRKEIGFLDPKYVTQYDAAREAYSKGNALLKMLSSGRNYREFPGTNPQLHTPELQRYISDNRGILLQRLGKDDFAKLVDAVTRGGGLGRRDVLVPGGGGVADAAQSWLRGQNTGATQALRVPIATALPNLGSQYAGRAPFSAPDQLKILLDVLGISATTGGTQ